MNRLHRLPAAAAATALLTLGAALPALAVPSSGPSSDTAGTSSSVSSSRVSQGDALSFTVDGFPANHTISVKIADGQYCGSGVRYGSGVVTRVTSDASGHASGTIVIPDDLTTGRYWLRFLTSNPATSNRGASDFSVVARSAATGDAGAVTTTEPTAAGSAASVGDGAVVSVPAPDAATAARTVTDDELPIAGGAERGGTERGGTGSDAGDDAADAGREDAGGTDALGALLQADGFPWPGTIALAGSVLLAAGAVTGMLLARRRGIASSAASVAGPPAGTPAP